MSPRHTRSWGFVTLLILLAFALAAPAAAQTANPDTFAIQPGDRFKRKGGGVRIEGVAPAVLAAVTTYVQNIAYIEAKRGDGWEVLGAARCAQYRGPDGEPEIVVIRDYAGDEGPNCTVRRKGNAP